MQRRGPLIAIAVAIAIVDGCQTIAAPSLIPSTSVAVADEPAVSCGVGTWSATTISCETAYRIGDQAGARVDRARIWLTTLGAVKATMHPHKQVTEPPDAAAVWAIVYDGSWRCCPNAFDQNGNTLPLVDMTTWLVVSEAAREGTGFIYLQDWSGQAVPDGLSPPGE